MFLVVLSVPCCPWSGTVFSAIPSSELIPFGPGIRADVGWPMSDERLSASTDPSIMKLMAEHWLDQVAQLVVDLAIAKGATSGGIHSCEFLTLMLSGGGGSGTQNLLCHEWALRDNFPRLAFVHSRCKMACFR